RRLKYNLTTGEARIIGCFPDCAIFSARPAVLDMILLLISGSIAIYVPASFFWTESMINCSSLGSKVITSLDELFKYPLEIALPSDWRTYSVSISGSLVIGA